MGALQDRVVAVTGAGRGLGRGEVRLFDGWSYAATVDVGHRLTVDEVSGSVASLVDGQPAERAGAGVHG